MNADLISKIQKLRALAQSDNANEAAAAAAKAEKLIAEHQLSEADLESETGEMEETEEAKDPVYVEGRISMWKSTLGNRLGHLYSVALIYEQREAQGSDGRWKTVNALRAIGRKSDVEILRYQFAYLTLEIQRLTAVWMESHTFRRGEGRTAANNFRLGVVQGVCAAMWNARNAATCQSAAAGSSAAMVLVDRAKLAEEKKKRLYPNAVRCTGRSNYDPEARAAGRRAGESIHQGGALGASVKGALGGGK